MVTAGALAAALACLLAGLRRMPVPPIPVRRRATAAPPVNSYSRSVGTHRRRRRRPTGRARSARSGGGGTGRHVAYCVRLCDGHYFPLQRHGQRDAGPSSAVRSARRARRKVFFGSSIDHAAAPTASAMPTSTTPSSIARRSSPIAPATARTRFGLAHIDGDQRSDAAAGRHRRDEGRPAGLHRQARPERRVRAARRARSQASCDTVTRARDQVAPAPRSAEDEPAPIGGPTPTRRARIGTGQVDEIAEPPPRASDSDDGQPRRFDAEQMHEPRQAVLRPAPSIMKSAAGSPGRSASAGCRNSPAPANLSGRPGQ